MFFSSFLCQSWKAHTAQLMIWSSAKVPSIAEDIPGDHCTKVSRDRSWCSHGVSMTSKPHFATKVDGWSLSVPPICAIFSNRDRLTFLGGSYCFLITSEWGWTSGKGHLTYLLRTSSILSIRKSIKCLDDFGERERERHRHQENPRVLINIWKYENNTRAVAGLEVQLPTPNLETL